MFIPRTKSLLPLLLSSLVLFIITGTVPKKVAPYKGDSKNNSKAVIAIHTDMGTMKAVLFNKTPKHRDNFLKLTREDFFDGTTFHRVIENFMIQGGSPLSKKEDPQKPVGDGTPGYTIPAEIHEDLFHERGAIGAARKGDRENPERKSNGSQFYIVQGRKYDHKTLNKMEERKDMRKKAKYQQKLLQEEENKPLLDSLIKARQEQDKEALKRIRVRLDELVDQEYPDAGFSYSDEQIDAYTSVGGAPHLDGSYTVFGKVIDGMEVIDKIAAVPTDDRDRPKDKVKMRIEVIKAP